MSFRLPHCVFVTATLLFSLFSAPTSVPHFLFPLSAQTNNDRLNEALQLFEKGTQLRDRGQPRKALETFRKLLDIARQIKNPSFEGMALVNIGIIHRNLAQYKEAIESYQKALQIFQALGDRAGEGISLNNIGEVYNSLGQRSEAIEFLHRALKIRQALRDRYSEGITLSNISTVYLGRREYPKALEFSQQALVIARETSNRRAEGNILNHIGEVYKSQGEYSRALKSYQQALAIAKDYPSDESTVINNLGGLYNILGQYSKALDLYQQSLAIDEKISDLAGVGKVLNNIGQVYSNQKRHSEALKFYQLARVKIEQVGDRSTEYTILNNIGTAYKSLEQPSKALEFLQKSLAISKEVGDRPADATLNNIGSVYEDLNQYAKALDFYQQALMASRQFGKRDEESIVLGNIGNILDKQKQSELAIAYLKQSINVTETIRQDLKNLGKQDRATYTDVIAKGYRKLADLLIQQNRVMEALQVLDLLKVQELEDYLKNVKGSEKTAQGVKLLPPEQHFFSSHKTFTDLEFSKNPAVNTLVRQLSQIPQAELNPVPESLKNIPKNSVLLYPVILGDRLELVLFSPGSPPVHRSVAVKKEELEAAIVTFKTELSRRPVSVEDTDDVKASAQKLYKWIIEPIKADLDRIKPQTITYAPDGKLRYIPLAALYDGKQWLVQQYRIHNIVSYNLTDFDAKPQPQMSVVAGAFGGKEKETRFNFNGLPATIPEVQNIAVNLPNTITLIEADFNRKALESKINNQKTHNILHLATHAQFVDGTPDASFILFGNGDKVTLREVKEWQLKHVDLVVLSACQTGLGGLGSGVEILGLGYQFQVAGSKSAIATLWEIDDGGTQVLMDKFYPALKQGMPTVEALYQAQLQLINGKPAAGQPDTSQPYYWSAFMLIGNGR